MLLARVRLTSTEAGENWIKINMGDILQGGAEINAYWTDLSNFINDQVSAFLNLED